MHQALQGSPLPRKPFLGGTLMNSRIFRHIMREYVGLFRGAGVKLGGAWGQTLFFVFWGGPGVKLGVPGDLGGPWGQTLFLGVPGVRVPGVKLCFLFLGRVNKQKTKFDPKGAPVRNGQPAPSGNWSARDGIPFSNREGFLPPSKKGYTEFRVLGKDGKPSGARILINEDNGSVYYSQHYNDDATGFSDITVIWQEMFGA